jgi:fructose-bisphosphate aldolase, class II
MALVNMGKMLNQARDGGYAVGAFNILDYNSMKAVVETAVETGSPVIIQTSVKTVLFWGYRTIVAWAEELAEKLDIPVAIHLDHCQDLQVIRKCIETGWTSVMIDASSRPYEENLRMTSEVVKMAVPRGVSVEAELGAIVGTEDDIHVKEQDSHLADFDQALDFCAKLDLDCFAPAVGTAHGVYKGEPKIDFSLIERISKSTGLPLALHGGTGLSPEVFHRGISLGCSKVNISTQLKYAHIDGFVNYHNDHHEYNPLKPLQAQYQMLREAVLENIKLFGSEGKA